MVAVEFSRLLTIIMKSLLLLILAVQMAAAARAGGRPKPTKSTTTTPAPTTTAPSPCSCGVSKSTRIVGGEDATPNEFPWQVGHSIFVYKGVRRGAVLIFPNVYLTEKG